MNRRLLVISLLVSINASVQQDSFNRDEPSKHRHAVEHLEPDPANSIFQNVALGRNPLQRTTASPRMSNRPNKKHSGTVIIPRRGRRSVEKNEKLDHEYDVLISDFSEDETPESVFRDLAVETPEHSTTEPEIYSTRIVGSAEVHDPGAVEAPVGEHRIHVPSHLVEHVQSSETKEAGSSSSSSSGNSTVLTPTQRALNLFVAVTTTKKPADISGESSGQEPPAPSTQTDKNALRSILTNKLSKLFMISDVGQPKMIKTIIPNKVKGPSKSIIRPPAKTGPLSMSGVKQQLENMEATGKSMTVLPVSLDTSSNLAANEPSTWRTVISSTKSRTPISSANLVEKTGNINAQSSTTLKAGEQTTKKHFARPMSVAVFMEDKARRREFKLATTPEVSAIQQQPTKILDGTVDRRTYTISHSVQNRAVLYKGQGLSRKKRLATNSESEVQSPTINTPNLQIDAIETQEIGGGPRTTTIQPEKAMEDGDSRLVDNPDPKQRLNYRDRDIILSEIATGVSDRKQVAPKGGGKEVGFGETKRPSVSAPAATRVVGHPSVARQQQWVPPPPRVFPQQRAGFVQPTFNHFVVGNRRVVIPSITYEQHVAQQQQQFWPQQQQFIPPRFVQNPAPRFVPNNMAKPTFNHQPTAAPQRIVLPATTDALLIRTTERVLPKTTPPPLARKVHEGGTSTTPPPAREVHEEVDFDLYDDDAEA